MRLALVQSAASPGDPQENLRRGLALCEEAKAGGADLVVFPELWQTGYAPCPGDAAGGQRWHDQATSVDGPWLGAFRAAARRLRLAVVTTFVEAHSTGPGNAAAVIDAAGRVTDVYRKVHVCDFGWERVFTPGPGFTVSTVRTAAGPVRLGVIICFDREQPEACRALALDGAELVVCPNASLLCDDRIGQVRARAFENSVAVAVANYPLPRMNGRSCLFDGRAVHRNRPRDHTVALADGRSRLVLADLDLAALREYRAGSIWGAAHRRPTAYASLTREVAR
ncbi:carbon-nitrogen hydrolase family protein [Kitasatospora purpeofusca]|uniref:carbon-nitrogen hydrolase family protein n=1 Tax=Kitasatospora purpeofusca TaxID=67352 RepID=UPI002A5ABED0|nr:carbon-nitrogen hydrolase family protein [Kitasatospora purpeofusca]MDY0812010.1 carbon-nitrogen hydrolase family protein [Kitasatospora purpeofusca]